VTALSVIIPTWCEAAGIGAAVERARAIGDEVIVVDADSPDGTAGIARAHGARVFTSGKGRGVQLARGAALAHGDVLLFLHADAVLVPAARGAIEDALRDPRVVGGNFRLRFDAQSSAARVFELVYHLQRRVLAHYYGDSAIFVRRAVYAALGGIAALPLFEDYHFVRRMERSGRTAYVRDVCVRVSARRFESAPWRTLFSWGVLQLGYSLGVPPQRLSALYADIRERAEQGERGART
jgi:rSAM/selenodomain-associated transferase 2